MYDEESDEYALVDKPRANVIAEAERDTYRASLIKEIELKIAMLFMTSEDTTEVGASWGAISSTTSQSARARIKELNGDFDQVVNSLDAFFLINPLP